MVVGAQAVNGADQLLMDNCVVGGSSLQEEKMDGGRAGAGVGEGLSR